MTFIDREVVWPCYGYWGARIVAGWEKRLRCARRRISAGGGSMNLPEDDLRATQPLLEVAGLAYAFGSDVALQSLSLSVMRGEILCVLGSSGVGKTTLLKLIAGLLRPTQGTISILGTNQEGIPPHRRNIGFVFQELDALFPHLNVKQNVLFPFRHGRRKAPGGCPESAVSQILHLTGLTSFASRPIRKLSGGEKQRVALARALVYEPALLLLDEPLASVDNILKDSLIATMAELHNRLGTTFIYVTHDEREAFRLASRIVVLANGTIEQDGTPRDLLTTPISSCVAKILGGWNIIHDSVPQLNEQNACVGIRYEQVLVSANTPDTSDGIITIPVQIIGLQHWYGMLRIACRTQTALPLVGTATTANFNIGQDAYVSINRSDLYNFPRG